MAVDHGKALPKQAFAILEQLAIGRFCPLDLSGTLNAVQGT